MRLRRPLPAVQGDTLHIVGVGDNRIGKGVCKIASRLKVRKKITAVIYARFEPESEDKAWSNTAATGNVSSLCSRYGVPLQD